MAGQPQPVLYVLNPDIHLKIFFGVHFVDRTHTEQMPQHEKKQSVDRDLSAIIAALVIVFAIFLFVIGVMHLGI